MGVAEFRTSFEAGDIEAAYAQFAPAFALYHTGHADPTTEPAHLRGTLKLARDVFGPEFRFTDHLVGGVYHGLPWTTRINGFPTEGVDLFKVDEHDRIVEFRISMRPFESIREWMATLRLVTGKTSVHDPDPPAAGRPTAG